jgi:hypothetical protein
VAEGGGQFIEPGARNLLALQAGQAIQSAKRDFGVLGSQCAGLASACAEIHQTSTETEQYSGQVGCDERRGFGAWHINVLEIVTRLFVDGDS